MIKAHFSERKQGLNNQVDFLTPEIMQKVGNFHRSFDEYNVTPLHDLSNLAAYYKLKGIFLKDESYRFGLNAFKVLGGAYAMGQFLAERLGVDIDEVSFDYLRSEEVRNKIGKITFVTATDGNHGKGVAWAANQLGQKAVVYMPKGSSQTRLENILKEGAEASIIDGNYEAAVQLADEMAQQHGWIVVQDTAWEGYEDIPTWIMQGYSTLVSEAMEQLEAKSAEPTHVFLQAGVGSFAVSVLGCFVNQYGSERPITVIVEPEDANCLYRSAISGHREIVEGDMPTIMAGLACGAPNTIAYEIIKDYADAHLSCTDDVTARGMRMLGAPLKGDAQIVSGESGAVGAGALALIMERAENEHIRKKLKLDENSVVLLISTEGDTDPQKYREILWDGANTSI